MGKGNIRNRIPNINAVSQNFLKSSYSFKYWTVIFSSASLSFSTAPTSGKHPLFLPMKCTDWILSSTTIVLGWLFVREGDWTLSLSDARLKQNPHSNLCKSTRWSGCCWAWLTEGWAITGGREGLFSLVYAWFTNILMHRWYLRKGLWSLHLKYNHLCSLHFLYR